MTVPAPTTPTSSVGSTATASGRTTLTTYPAPITTATPSRSDGRPRARTIANGMAAISTAWNSTPRCRNCTVIPKVGTTVANDPANQTAHVTTSSRPTGSRRSRKSTTAPASPTTTPTSTSTAAATDT